MIKRTKGLLIAILLIVVSIMATLAGCGQQDATQDVTGTDVTDQSTTEETDTESQPFANSDSYILKATPGVAPEWKYEHEKSFSVMTVGTGCPIPALGRSQPSTLVQYNGTYFLIDTGDGTVDNLCYAGIPVQSIKNVLFTHLHADHTGGYQQFLINSWMFGRKSLELVGPAGTKTYHDMYIDFFLEDFRYRMGINKSRTPEGILENINTQELAGANTFELDGVTITTAEMTHTMYNLAYRFDVGGQSIVVSGDTDYDEDLIALATGVDVLVIDTTTFPTKGNIGLHNPLEEGSPTPEVKVVDYEGSHATIEEVAQMVSKAQPKKIVLTHFQQFIVDKDATAKIIKDAGYEGEIIFGTDLLEVYAD